MNYIPIIGWAISLFFNASLAVSFWFLWTYCQLGTKYFYWLPSVYLTPDFFNCIGLFMIIGMLKQVLVPKFSYVTQTNTEK